MARRKVGPTMISQDIVDRLVFWIQDELTDANTADFIRLRDFHQRAIAELDDILNGYKDVLGYKDAEKLRKKVVERIYGTRFRRNVQHALLKDRQLPVAVTLVNEQCIEDRERGYWGDHQIAMARRGKWLPRKDNPGHALVHNSAAGLAAVEAQTKSIAGGLVTAFKRILAWVMRDLETEDAMRAGAMIGAAGKVFDARWSHDTRYTERRDELVKEYKRKMAI